MFLHYFGKSSLQLQLFLNLLKLGRLFPRQPEILSTYMQQHLLENPHIPRQPRAYRTRHVLLFLRELVMINLQAISSSMVNTMRIDYHFNKYKIGG
jgi:hypothetical protein